MATSSAAAVLSNGQQSNGSTSRRSSGRRRLRRDDIPVTMEEYRLDERELAALQRLYECPSRPVTTTPNSCPPVSAVPPPSPLRRSTVSHVRAFGAADTLTSRHAAGNTSRLAAGSTSVSAANLPVVSALADSGVVSGVEGSRRRAQSSTRLDAGRTALPVTASSSRAASSSMLGATTAPNAALDRQQAIARLLAEAALSPPPPIPTRRPLQARHRPPCVTPATSSSPTALSADRRRHWHDRQHSLDGLQPTEHGEGEKKDTHCTPDWIGNIFTLARAGDLAKLSTAVADMQPAMVRNLTDHHGNNLCHVLAACGHVTTLSWLLASCGQPIADALTDENARGITPSVAAIRFGQLEVIQWLVQNTTVVRDCLFCKDGQRSLLHVAAKYGQLEITVWCCDQLLSEERSISTSDRNSETPLHLASRHGHLAIVQALLTRGAVVTARNNMSMKPYELAVSAGHSCCAEHLLLHEAFSELCVDFSSLQAETARLQHDNADYKNNFREVLSVSRKLLRERDDMCTELGRLHDSTLQLNDRLISQIKQLQAENSQLRRRLNEPDEEQTLPDELVTSVAGRWQACRRGWFSSQLADTQHRVLRAEQAWQRLRAGSAAQAGTSAIDIMVNKLADLRAQAAGGGGTDARAASDTSLVDSELYQQIGPAHTASSQQSAGRDASLLERLSVSTRSHSGAAWRGRPALAAAGGSASVLEVVEPAGDEAQLSGHQLVQREIEAQRRLQQVPLPPPKPGRPVSGYMSDSHVGARSRDCWWRASTEPDLLKGTGQSRGPPSLRSAHGPASNGPLSLPTDPPPGGSGRHYSAGTPELARALCLPVVCTAATTVMTASVTTSTAPVGLTALPGGTAEARAASPAVSDTSCTESARLEAQPALQQQPETQQETGEQQSEVLPTKQEDDRAWYEMSDDDEPPPVPLPSCPPVTRHRRAVP